MIATENRKQEKEGVMRKEAMKRIEGKTTIRKGKEKTLLLRKEDGLLDGLMERLLKEEIKRRRRLEELQKH